MTGTELRRLRKRLGLSQAAMAGIVGIIPNSLARLERGERRIGEPMARLVRLIAAQMIPAKRGRR